MTANDQGSLTVKALTKREREWMEELEAVLMRAPGRLQLVAVGDNALRVIDGPTHDAGADIHDGRAERAGFELGYVTSRCPIHSTTC
jgi:hypothetical protein